MQQGDGGGRFTPQRPLSTQAQALTWTPALPDPGIMKPASHCLPHPGTDPGPQPGASGDLLKEFPPQASPCPGLPPDLDPRASAPLATRTCFLVTPSPSSCQWAPFSQHSTELSRPCARCCCPAVPGGGTCGVVLWPLCAAAATGRPPGDRAPFPETSGLRDHRAQCSPRGLQARGAPASASRRPSSR